jgi:hypothetical protein
MGGCHKGLLRQVMLRRGHSPVRSSPISACHCLGRSSADPLPRGCRLTIATAQCGSRTWCRLAGIRKLFNWGGMMEQAPLITPRAPR